jgi:hypothetical protein
MKFKKRKLGMAPASIINFLSNEEPCGLPRGSSLLFDVVFLPEPFDASGGVYQFLLAGEEGVAG